MKIRNKILLYFSTTVIALTVLSAVIIFVLFSAYREEEFQQRQKQKIEMTIEFLQGYQEMTEELTRILDKLTIDDFYDEKMIIYDNNKNQIYKSVDDLKIKGYQAILNSLSPATQWIETKEDQYDLIGVYIENNNSHFYAISKAYDEFGYTKLDFLRNILILITAIIAIIVLIVTYYLSKKIAQPLTQLAEQLSSFNMEDVRYPIIDAYSDSFEIDYLIQKFNQLIKSTNESFAFQKHAVQHISHELKTPIAVLVSELERASMTSSLSLKNEILHQQLVKAKMLGDIINTLLEISKIESGQAFQKTEIRLDELIFELVEEYAYIFPDFQFEILFKPEIFEDYTLNFVGNKLLMKQVFLNLLENAIKYTDGYTAQIVFDCSQSGHTIIRFINNGKILSKEEERFLFQHFFRGNQTVQGFGLGLVLVQKIMQLHKASIHYIAEGNYTNIFEMNIPIEKQQS